VRAGRTVNSHSHHPSLSISHCATKNNETAMRSTSTTSACGEARRRRHRPAFAAFAAAATILLAVVLQRPSPASAGMAPKDAPKLPDGVRAYSGTADADCLQHIALPYLLSELILVVDVFVYMIKSLQLFPVAMNDALTTTLMGGVVTWVAAS